MTRCPKLRMALVIAVTMPWLSTHAAGTEVQAVSPRVQVVFEHPEQFLDVRDRNNPTQKGEKEILSTLRDYITQRAPKFLPDGAVLKITFVNIKLAGVFNVGDVSGRRVILATTPPMFKFEWTVTDRTGKLVGSAREILEENDFKDLSSGANEGDPYRYEKGVLDDWMRNRLQS